MLELFGGLLDGLFKESLEGFSFQAWFDGWQEFDDDLPVSYTHLTLPTKA